MRSIPSSRRRRVVLEIEELETRLMPSGSTPSGLEEELIERLNDARANPAAYGTAIGLDLSTVAPSQPLAVDPLLTEAAQLHSQDMNDRNYFNHFTPEGLSPLSQVAATGYSAIAVSQSIAAGYGTPEQALAALIIDAGVPDLGHRMQLLALDPTDAAERQIGTGIVLNGTGFYSDYYTIDTAQTSDNRAFLTGAAFNDADGNGLYDAGEGVSVTITVAGVGSFQSFSTGGYSIPLDPGTYIVTFSGGGLPTRTGSFTIGTQNVRLDFTQNGFLGPASPVAPVSVSTSSGTTTAAGGQIIVSAADAGGPPVVNVYDAKTRVLKTSFDAFPASFTGGVRVAVGDIEGAGFDDIIVGAGPGGGPEVRVFSGKTFQMIRDFMALPTQFTGGIFVAAGDVSGDGFDDIITSADAGGGPEVTIWSGMNGSNLAAFYATAPSFSGGIRVAAADLNGDGHADVIAAAGPGGGPQVTIFDGRTMSLLTAFYALPSTFTGGMYIAAGDLTGNGKADIIVGAAPGGGPEVSLFNGADQTSLGAFYALAPTFTGGVRVAAGDTTGTGRASILTAAGPGGGPQLSIFDGISLQLLDSFFASAPTFTGGIFVGAH